MVKPIYEERHKEILDTILLGLPGVKAGKMFGYPEYYINKNLFACIFGEGAGVKVPQHLAKELLKRPHVAPFQPLGKSKMREWVQINRKRSVDYKKDFAIFQSSVQFVKRQKTRGEKKS